mmetsp:Transcript_28655/g.93037  ORF Transcript_28655/g.93037 Transcript_28655/m.93037 type:complete len:205 (+) Transcript_28655:1970-2584(+)
MPPPPPVVHPARPLLPKRHRRSPHLRGGLPRDLAGEPCPCPSLDPRLPGARVPLPRRRRQRQRRRSGRQGVSLGQRRRRLAVPPTQLPALWVASCLRARCTRWLWACRRRTWSAPRSCVSVSARSSSASQRCGSCCLNVDGSWHLGASWTGRAQVSAAAGGSLGGRRSSSSSRRGQQQRRRRTVRRVVAWAVARGRRWKGCVCC